MSGSLSASSHSDSEFACSDEDKVEDLPTSGRRRAAFASPSRSHRSTNSIASAASTSTAGSQRERLPRVVEKQLILDIIDAGGIKEFSFGKKQALSKLLDKPDRQGTYGDRGDPIRGKISKRVNYWKGRPIEKFNKTARRILKTDPEELASETPPVVTRKTASTSSRKKPARATPTNPRKPSARSQSQSRPNEIPNEIPSEINTSLPNVVSPLLKRAPKASTTMAPTSYRKCFVDALPFDFCPIFDFLLVSCFTP